MKANQSKKVRKVLIGKHIKHWRAVKEIKLQTLAEAIGITKAAMSNIENDVTEPNLGRMEAIADALGITVAELLTDPFDKLNKTA